MEGSLSEPFLLLSLMRVTYQLAFLILLLSCKAENRNASKNRITIPETVWRFTMDLNGDLLPFTGTFTEVKDYSATLTLHNADEEIVIQDVILRNDSLIANLPFFNTAFKMRVESPYMLSGIWINYDKENYKIPITAEQGQDFRFTNSQSRQAISDRYFVRFQPDSKGEYPAILELENRSGRLKGTFLTETGDYRFLEGNIMNNSIYLSTFDGSHAFFFKASIKGDSLVNGIFKSGTHYEAEWIGLTDSLTSLAKPESITTITSQKPFDFNLINEKGEEVNWNKADLDGKVVILDIMGTWCPNCMDASRALAELAQPYSNSELVVLPVLFEYKDDLESAKNAFSEYAHRLDIPNRFLFGGKASKKGANKKFPMLSSISSFPTLIFIGKDRRVSEIYTGFYGPGTGEHYSEFIQEKKELIARLVEEEY
jgi:thiol-disulfide isomerase/thioredoxin